MTSSPNLELNKEIINAIFIIGYRFIGASHFIDLAQLLALFLAGFIPFATIYCVVRKETTLSTARSAIVALVPSLLYLVNPWILDRINNDLFMVLGMAVSPLLFYLCYKAFEGVYSFGRVLRAAVCLAVVSMLSSHSIFYWVPLIGLLALLLLLFGKNHRKQIVLSSSLFAALYLLLSAFWILPLVVKSQSAAIQPSYHLSLASIVQLSERNTPVDVLGLSGGGAWRETLQTAPLPLNIGLATGLFAIIMAVLGIYFYPHKKPVMISAVFLLLLLLLSMGTNAPIPIFQWFFNSPLRPIIWLYRDPSRFIQFLLVPIVALVAYATYFFVKLTDRAKHQTIVLWSGFALCLLVVAASPAAYSLAKSADGTLVASTPPADYQKVASLLKYGTKTGKALWFPVRGYYFYNWNNASDVAGDFYTASSPIPTYTLNTSAGSAAAMNQYIYQKIVLEDRMKNMGVLLTKLNVKYVAVHTDMTGWQQQEAKNVVQILSGQRDLSRVYRSRSYVVFQNLDYHDSSVSLIGAKDVPKGDTQKLPSVTKGTTIYSDAWSVSPGSSMRRQGGVYTWKVGLNSGQNSYSASYEYSGKFANFDPYDEVNFSILPDKMNTGSELSIVVQTDQDSFTFNRYNLKLGQWNDVSLNLRAADQISTNNGGKFDLSNVKSITFGIYGKTPYGRYYRNGQNSFLMRGLNLQSDNTYGNYDPTAVVAMFNNITSKKVGYRKIGSSTVVTSPDSLARNGSLVFAESYDPAWRLVAKTTEGKLVEVKPKPFYGVVNAFSLSDIPTNAKLTIIYKTDHTFRIGVIISSVTFIGCTVFLIENSLRQRRVGRKERHYVAR